MSKTILRSLALLLGLFILPAIVFAASYPAQISTVDSIANLKALGVASSQYKTIQVLGYNSPGDGGGGLFIYTPLVVTPDSCVNFSPTGVTGTWIRQLNGQNLSVEMCGAYHDSSHPQETHTAFQAANDYTQAVGPQNQTIEFKGSDYNFGTFGGVVKSSSNLCPRWIGGGYESTVIRMQPTVETAAFTFVGGSGAISNCGVSQTRIAGNGNNTIGCEFNGQGGGYCNIAMTNGLEPILFCNCFSGAFTEQVVANPNLQDMSNVTRAGEYRVSNGGQASFHGSGFGPDTYIASSNLTSGSSLISIGTGAYVYNAPFSAHWFAAGGGNQTLINNNSSNVATFTTGTLEIETSDTDRLVLGLGVQTVYGGTIYGFGGNVGGTGAAIQVGKLIQANSYFVGTAAEYHDATGLYTSTSFTGTSGITLTESPVSTSFGSYQVTITGVNGDGTYIWTGTVLTNSVNVGSCGTPTVVGGILIVDSHSWGAPTITCTSDRPNFTNTNWTSGNFVITYSVHTQ